MTMTMTASTARTAANVLLIAAAATAAYYILKTPSIRRPVLRLTKAALASGLPAYLAAEVGRAWVESERVA